MKINVLGVDSESNSARNSTEVVSADDHFENMKRKTISIEISDLEVINLYSVKLFV